MIASMPGACESVCVRACVRDARPRTHARIPSRLPDKKGRAGGAGCLVFLVVVLAEGMQALSLSLSLSLSLYPGNATSS